MTVIPKKQEYAFVWIDNIKWYIDLLPTHGNNDIMAVAFTRD